MSNNFISGLYPAAAANHGNVSVFNIFDDIAAMHNKFGATKRVSEMTPLALKRYLNFRIAAIQEEVDELNDAFVAKDAEGVVDALIDMMVFAAGTLDLFRVHGETAWTEVYRANMEKIPGENPNRPNKFGFPDLIKPDGWVGPDHSRNHGTIQKALDATKSDETI